MPGFINFRNYSDFSLGVSAAKLDDLITSAKRQQQDALALSDKYNLFASLEFSSACLKSKIQPIIANVLLVQVPGKTEEIKELLLVAKNSEGIAALTKLSSLSYLRSERYKADKPFVTLSELAVHKEGLVLLYGGKDSWAEWYIEHGRMDEAESLLLRLNEMFAGNLYIEISRNNRSLEEVTEPVLLQLALKHNLPIIGSSESTFPEGGDMEAHDALLCILSGRYVVEETRERSNPFSYIKTQTELLDLFADLPEAIENTEVLKTRCSAYCEERKPLLPGYPDLTPGLSTAEELEKQATAGLLGKLRNLKYPIEQAQYLKRLSFELSVINKMNYPGYFLIVSDFIRWCKGEAIPVGPGRGSGAGSVVAWALDITDLDPIRYGLLFERFLNPERVSMPDFDIDFCQVRRDEVIQYVQRKYGADKVAQIVTFGKLQARAVLRDVGRVLQIPYRQVDSICKLVPTNPTNPVTLKDAIDLDKSLRNMADEDPDIANLLDISLKLEGANRHVSTHAAGIVIADRPLDELIPLYRDSSTLSAVPTDGGKLVMPAVQYTMKYAEGAGLIKFDFLGLKTLTVISSCVELIRRHSPEFILDNCEFEDLRTYELLSLGKTTGVFQFESAGMKEAIKKLKPDHFNDLIALGSLYRPGPMDNIPSYINRKHGFEAPRYLHPALESILAETYGIIVYQEQVIEIAQKLAGYTLGGADLLRRAMGKKIKAEMEAQRVAFISGCIAQGVAEALAEEVFELVNKFASYGFNKSHAAAYAVISYQTAFLKANYTIEFLVASINLEILDTNKINLFVQEARDFNIKVIFPNINQSESAFTISSGREIIYGLASLKNVGFKIVDQVVAERMSEGKFKSLSDFLSRTGKFINKRALESFIKSGALDSLNPNRHQMLSAIEALLKFAASHTLQKSLQNNLFGDESLVQPLTLPEVEEWTEVQKLNMEFEAVGFYLSCHPLASFRTKLGKIGVLLSNEVEQYATAKGAVLNFAGVIVSKKIRSSKRGKYAFLQLSDEYGLLEVSIFNDQLLYKFMDDLVVGRHFIFALEAKVDETGVRSIVTNIVTVEEFSKSTVSCYTIYLETMDDYEYVRSNLNESAGNQVRFIVGSTGVMISGIKKLLTFDGMMKLKRARGLKIVEM